MSTEGSEPHTLTIDETGWIHSGDFCKGKIAHYKIPRYIKFVDEYPMTVTGKIQKFKMRNVVIAQLGLEEDAGIETA